MSNVYFIILNYGNPKSTINLIQTIKSFNEPKFKILIVDNFSNQKNQDLIDKACNRENILLFKTNKNLGYAKGNNIALKYIYDNKLSTYAFICNPDIKIDLISVNTLIETMIENKSAIVGGQAYDNNHEVTISHWKFPSLKEDVINSIALFKIFFKKKKYNPNYSGKVDVIQGAFFLCDLSKLLKVGFFDEETFLYCEERIIGYKLQKKGFHAFFNPDVKFHHVGGESTKRYYKKISDRIDFLLESRYIYHNKILKNKIPRIYFNIFKSIAKIEKKILYFFKVL